MLIAAIIIIAVAFAGSAVTYLFADDEPFLWRITAGNVIGSAVFGTACFVVSLLSGFNTASVLVSLLLAMLPLALLARRDYRSNFLRDWAKAKGKLQGGNLRKALRAAYYAAFLLLFFLFFGRVMIETDAGIFTGGSQNLGDLPFHLGAIFGFTDGNNFPPENPSFAGARFSYPFVADLLTACLVKLGAGVRDAMVLQNVSWAFSLLVILERFVFKLTGDRLAGRIAPFLLFYSGGLGFLWFFNDFWVQDRGVFEFLWNLPRDYTISDQFRWGNSLVTLFLTQRSLLLGMPLTLVVLGVLWKIFTAETQRRREGSEKFSIFNFQFSIFTVGLLAGMLPLIHLHSLAVLFVIGVFCFVLRVDKWQAWIAFAVGVAVIAIPELLWLMTGSATETGEFFAFHFGWDRGETNFIWFWIKNTGLAIPMIAMGIYMIWATTSTLPIDAGEHGSRQDKAKRKSHKKHASDDPLPAHHPSSLLLFYLPFAFLFLVTNVAKLAPWEWDNIKVLIYWFVGSVPFIAFALAWMWRQSRFIQAAGILCFVVLTFSGVLDVWRAASGQINYKVFDADAILVADRIRKSTEPRALFLNAPTYNSAVVLAGRRSLMRYPGHLGSHGIDYGERERDVKTMYRGGPEAAKLFEKYGIQYVLISPEERNSLSPNERYFEAFPVVAQADSYKVFKIR